MRQEHSNKLHQEEHEEGILERIKTRAEISSHL